MFKPIDRRTLLRGVAGVAIALPWLETMGCSSDTPRRGTLGRSSAAVEGSPGLTKDGFPKRLVGVASPNGTLPQVWFPSQPGTAFTLGPIHQPLQAYRDRMVLLRGVHNEAGKVGPGAGHYKGQCALFTGREAEGPEESALIGSGISFDQVIADAIAQSPQPTAFKSLVLGSRAAGALSALSYAGPKNILPSFLVAKDLFDKIFADTSSEEVARLTARRKSILDGARRDMEALRSRVSASDRVRLDSHFDAIRQIEKRFESLAQCNVKNFVPGTASSHVFDLPAMAEQMFDVLALAFACDVSRVATYMFRAEGGNSSHTFSWIPGLQPPENPAEPGVDPTDDENSFSHHSMSHYDGTEKNIDRLTKVNAWFMSMIAGLADRLKALPEGDGTVLDHSVILYGSGIAQGNHSLDHVPFLLVGNAGGALKTGQFLDLAAGRPHNDLLLTVMQAMGVQDTSFGDPKYCTGPIQQLLA